jgi:hypothetical protein
MIVKVYERVVRMKISLLWTPNTSMIEHSIPYQSNVALGLHPIIKKWIHRQN